jgi:hypothetical protein
MLDKFGAMLWGSHDLRLNALEIRQLVLHPICPWEEHINSRFVDGPTARGYIRIAND